MVAPSMRSGAAAEALAAEYLKSQGLILLARNLRSRCGELDLVGLDGEVLVIVEVRQRGSRDFGGALASVTRRKQRRLIRAARFEWQRRPAWRTRTVRFDVVALQGRLDGTPAFEWIKDAFGCA
jgi:putative endonuclease